MLSSILLEIQDTGKYLKYKQKQQIFVVHNSNENPVF